MNAERENLADEIPHTPSRYSHRCAARDCPMAGALADGSNATNWWCAYHHACPTNDIPRVTSVLHQHKDLRDVIADGRAVLADPQRARDISGEWKRMADLLRFGGYTLPEPRGVENFAGFLYRCEVMLGGFVVKAMRGAAPDRRAA
jgi:hypothetical protein